MEQPARLCSAFHAAINAKNIGRLGEMMTADHRFVDSAGSVVAGKQACLVAWRSFFVAFPDYRNIVASITASDSTVAMTGHSQCSDSRLDGPALWRAVVEGEELAEWQVLEDTPENRTLIRLYP